MMNHAHKYLNIKLPCFQFSYLVDSAKFVNNHNQKEHPAATSSTKMELEEVGQKEAKEVVAAISLGQKQE